MIDDFDLEGEWWTPNNSEEKVGGNLKFTHDEGLKLSLNGIFEDFEKIDAEKFNIILGNTPRGAVTICDFTMWGKTYYGTFITSQFKVNWAFIGKHYNTEKEIKIKNMSIEFAYLRQWLNDNPFVIAEPSCGTIDVEYRNPRKKKFLLKNGYCIKYMHRCKPPRRIDIYDELTLRDNVYVSIEAPKEVHYKELIWCSRAIEIFLYLGVQENTIADKKWFNNAPEADNENEIEIICKQDHTQNIHRHMNIECLFSFEDIAGEAEKYLSNWFDTVTEYEEAISLYYTATDEQRDFRNRFLNMAQAIEFFHRKKYGGKYLASKEYKDIVRDIYAIIDKRNNVEDCVKDIFKNKIASINSHTLRDRLGDVFERYSTIECRIKENEWSDLIKEVVNARNYYTHYDEKLKKGATHGYDLWSLSEKLRFVFEMMLLNEIGFEDKTVTHFLERPTSYHTENTNYRF